MTREKDQKKSKPKVSLIIPAYNEEKYIGECLEYVIKNSNGFFHEIIVVDNASTDKTAEVAKKYPGVKVVREDKKGLTKARQRGLIESTGEILANIDADTRLPAGWCEILSKEFEDEKIVTLSGRYIYYDMHKFRQVFVWMYWHFMGVPSYWLTGYMLVGGNFAIRKDVLEKMGGFDTTIEFYGEDTNIARRASKFGKVKFKPSFAMPTSARRLHKQGVIEMAYIYVLNFLHEVVLHRPATQKYEDHR
jgi:glycosyltransferase involved in cell wall biosynthesis